MARGDGKARKGLTKASKPRYGSDGVQRMAFGGKPGESAMSRAEASRPGPSSSGGGLGSSSRDGGFGGASRSTGGGGNNDRIGSGSRVSDVTSRTERASAMTNPAAMNARLGPNAAQAMVDAGVSPDTAIRAAMSINRSVNKSPSIIGDKSPGQRMATFNPDGSITYSAVPNLTKTKQFYDRILPEEGLSIGQTPATLPSQFAELGRIREEAKRSLAELDRQNLGLPSQNAPFQMGKGSPAFTGYTSSQNAPFQSGKGSPPVKTIADRLPVGSIKDQSRLPAGYTGPTVGPVYTPPATPTSPLPRPRPVQPVVSPPAKPKPASFAPKEKRQEGSVFTKNGVRYQIRDGKAYNFNVPGSSKAKPGVRDKDLERLFRGKKDGGAVRNTDGIATSGKTRGRYI